MADAEEQGATPRKGPRGVTVLTALGVVVCGAALPCGWTAASVVVALVIATRELSGCQRWGALCGGLLLALLTFAPMLNTARVKVSHVRCRNNLQQLGLALILSRDSQGHGAQLPATDGADFLVTLYAAEVTTEPDLFLCPGDVALAPRLRSRPCLLPRSEPPRP